MPVLVCTRDDRVVRLERGGSWDAEPVLEQVSAQCVVTDGARVLVGTQGDGLYMSEDAGTSWIRAELPESDVLSVAISRADGALYAGTEPSRLFVSRDGGRWTELEALQEIPSRDQWSFPPRPWTHHVRWIAPDPQRAERLLVGLMYSEDGGRASPITGQAQSATLTKSSGTRARRAGPTRPPAMVRPGAGTAGRAGRRRTRAGTCATAGRQSSIRPIRSAGTYPQPPGQAPRTGGGTRPGGSTAGRTAGAPFRSPPTPCHTRSWPATASSSPEWRTAAC